MLGQCRASELRSQPCSRHLKGNRASPGLAPGSVVSAPSYLEIGQFVMKPKCRKSLAYRGQRVPHVGVHTAGLTDSRL